MCENIFNEIKEIFEKNKTVVMDENKKLMKIEGNNNKNIIMYEFGSDILIKLAKKNFYLYDNKVDALFLDPIDVVFLYNDGTKECQSDIFECYSVKPIVEACKLLNMKKPLLMDKKIDKEKIKLTGLDKNYKKSIYSQIKNKDTIKNIYIVDIYDNIFTLGSEFINKRNIILENKSKDISPVANTYIYDNIKFFDEYYNLYFHDNNKNKNSKFTFVYNENRKKILESLINFLEGNTAYNISYICGPKSSGKTTTLIHLKNINIQSILYINLKAIYSLSGNDRLNLLLNETVLFFKNAEEQQKFFEEITNFQENIDEIAPNQIILNLINGLFQKYINLKFILDQYKDENDQEGNMKKELINIFSKNKDAKLIICSSINDKDIRTIVLPYLINNDKKDIEIDSIKIQILYVDNLYSLDIDKIKCSELKKELLEEFNYLPRIANKILIKNDNELQEFKSDQEEKINKKLNDFLKQNKIEKELFFNSYFMMKEFEEDNKYIKKEYYEELIKNLPLKYFITEKKSNDKFKIKVLFPLVHTVIEQFFIDNLSNLLLKINKLPQGLRGYIFEYAVINSIEKKYPNLVIKKVKNIYKINLEEESKLDFDTQLFYSIRQNNYCGKFYDYALYLGKEKKLIIFQITLHKEWKDIPSRDDLQKNIKNILTNINKEKIILKENDIYFYFVIPNSEKIGEPGYNKKMEDFISDLKKYKYKYLEFNIEKNCFDNFELNYSEDSDSKMFNNINPIFKSFTLSEKKKSLDINNMKIISNNYFLSKKRYVGNILEEYQNDVVIFLNNEKKLYYKLIKYLKLSNEYTIIIINENSKFNDIFVVDPFVLVFKSNDDFIIIHKKSETMPMVTYSLKKGKKLEFNFSDIYDYDGYYVFQIVKKNELINFNEETPSKKKKKK